MSCPPPCLPPFSPQVDMNKDRLVTLEEFLKSTEKKEFNEAGGWEVSGGGRWKEAEAEIRW